MATRWVKLAGCESVFRSPSRPILDAYFGRWNCNLMSRRENALQCRKLLADYADNDVRFDATTASISKTEPCSNPLALPFPPFFFRLHVLLRIHIRLEIHLARLAELGALEQLPAHYHEQENW
jgi:hypothetical protein